MPKRMGCRGKIKYVSRDDAAMKLRRLRNKGLTTYPCKVCGGWHIGNSGNPLKIQDRISQLLKKGNSP
jgi:hypothetical protein